MTPRRYDLFLAAILVAAVCSCEEKAAPMTPVPSRDVAGASSAKAPTAACVAGRAFCSADGVRRCNAQGTASEEVTRCGAGSACRITAGGPACAACDPDAVATCKDDRFVAACKADGTVETTDCAAQKKRCLNGACVATSCEPGKPVCDNGNLHTCNAAGSGSTLAKDCRAGNEICQDRVEPPACRARCKAARGVTMVLATNDCEACDWSKVPFCEEESPERACGTTLCADGQSSAGATMLPCYRKTAGLVVPGSERRGACSGAGETGTVTIAYQVCREGKAVAASRTAPCQR